MSTVAHESSSARFSGLSFRLSVGMLVFAIVMAAAYYGLVHRPVLERLRELEQIELFNLHRSVRTELRLGLQAAVQELESLASFECVLELDSTPTQALLEQQATTVFKKFTLMDANGRIVARSSDPGARGADRSDRQYFRETAHRRRMFVGDLETRPGVPSISIGVPVLGTEGDFVGVLAGHVDLSPGASRMFSDVRNLVSGTRFRALLLGRMGHPLASSVRDIRRADVEGQAPVDHPLRKVGSEEFRATTFEQDGTEYFGGVSIDPETGWMLILESEHAPALAGVESIVNRVALLFGVVFAILLLLVALYAARVVAPINRLTASLVQFGKVGESSALSEVQGGGEVGDALRAFNQMVGERRDVEMELLRQRAELQALARELARVEQRMRHEIAGELHDHISQDLAATKIRLELLRHRQTSTAREESLQVAIDLLSRSIHSTAMMTERLAHPSLRQLGLVPALEQLVETQARQSGVQIDFESGGVVGDVDDEIADSVYRGVRELLHNIVKHARAGHALVRLVDAPGGISISVRDDGTGFDPHSLMPAPGRVGGYGLFSFRERVRQFGGQLDIESAPGEGSCVTFFVPRKAPLDSAAVR